MKLYYSPGACSLAPHILMRELGQSPELIKVDLAAKKLPDGSDYLEVNPKGYVPAITLDDGTVFTEVSVILQLLADKAGKTELLPKAGTTERYRALETLNFVSTELHKGISGLFNPKMPEERKEAIKARVGQRLSYVNELLGRQSFMLGDHFTIADAYLFTVLGWASLVNMDLSPYPNITAYQGRIAARPAVQAALKAEGLTK